MSIFCPPAGAVAGVALAAADMYSAASGKDWMTGRELDDGERLMRGAFALFDLIPGVGYLNDLAKTGKVAGFAGIKASLRTSFKEGMEQAAKNVDNFKVVLKNVDDFGKRVVTKIDDFGKQATDILRSIRDEAYQLADGSFDPNFGKHIANVYMPGSQIDEGLEASKRFTLNGGGNVESVAEHWTKQADEILTDGSHMNGKYPKPNVIYQTGEHNYLYRTDEFGRIDRAYAENLQFKLHNGRLSHKRQTLDKQVGDHAGHIFGDLFGGSPELDNLISQAKDVNLKEYRRIERDWAEALEKSKNIEVDIKITYDIDSMRPKSFEVNYKIDGEPYKEIIPNINK
ncbi:DNA/RNA non-specific endonuclease [Streptococcus pluranimalium]|uniref:DNA/RNA non-specific endonuclease n=1 Tax=Streptococcus pluranimalium TaxID=82348 RepID=UPI0039FD478C